MTFKNHLISSSGEFGISEEQHLGRCCGSSRGKWCRRWCPGRVRGVRCVLVMAVCPVGEGGMAEGKVGSAERQHRASRGVLDNWRKQQKARAQVIVWKKTYPQKEVDPLLQYVFILLVGTFRESTKPIPIGTMCICAQQALYTYSTRSGGAFRCYCNVCDKDYLP